MEAYAPLSYSIMKSKVVLSKFSLLLTIAIPAILIVGLWAKAGTSACVILAFILAILLLSAGLFGPLWIEADGQRIKIRSLLRSHTIPLSEIVSVRAIQPTMGALRICGSGGFMGYWGLFREGDIGPYRAYYGKASQCFLVTLRDGKKYMLGCQNPAGMVSFISRQLAG